MAKNSIQVLIASLVFLLCFISCQKDELLSPDVFEDNVAFTDTSSIHVTHLKFQ